MIFILPQRGTSRLASLAADAPWPQFSCLFSQKFLYLHLTSRLEDVSHGKSPIRGALFPHLVRVLRVPVEAELGEADHLEDRLGLPVDLGLLPLAVRRLRHQGLKAEASRDGGARQCCVVLVPQVDSDDWPICQEKTLRHSHIVIISLSALYIFSV